MGENDLSTKLVHRKFHPSTRACEKLTRCDKRPIYDRRLARLLSRGTLEKDMANPRTPRTDARERILAAAYELFSHRGVRDVGVDELVEKAGVANATFYRHFASKNELVLAFLERREELWTMSTIISETVESGGTVRDRLLAIFDVFDEWFHRRDYEGDPFVTVLIEMGPEHVLGKASIQHLGTVRSKLEDLARQGGLNDPASFARSWQILMKGSIIAARMGDREAAARAREMGSWLIDHHEPARV